MLPSLAKRRREISAEVVRSVSNALEEPSNPTRKSAAERMQETGTAEVWASGRGEDQHN